METETTVAHPWWARAAMWLTMPAVGGGLGWLLHRAAQWVADLTWAPLQGPAKLIASAPQPHAVVVALVVGAATGLVLAGYVDRESLTIRISATQVTLSRPGTTRTIHRSAVAAAFRDGDRLVLLGPAGDEVARQPAHLSPARLGKLFGGYGIAWHDTDPHADAYRRWVPGSPDLTAAGNALFTARQRALDVGDEEDADELRGELGRLGLVVRDTGKRQYWRRAAG